MRQPRVLPFSIWHDAHYPQRVATNPRVVGELTLSIANEVRRQRQHRVWQQAELSAASDIPQGTLSRIERGLTAIDVEQIEKIAKAYGMQAEELVSLARRNAALQDGEQFVYRPDGSLNPSQTKGFPVSDSHIAELLAQANEDSRE